MPKLNNPRPLLVFAHKGEAQAFLTHFRASPIRLPSLEKIALFEAKEFFLLLSGEGRVGTCQKLGEVLEVLAKDLSKVINLGVAGALGQGPPLGSVYLVDQIFAFQVPALKCSPATGLELSANLFTADQRILSGSEALELAKLAPMVDREAHGLAQAAQLYDLPFISVKVISDQPWQMENTASDRKYQKSVQEKAGEWSALLLQAYNRLS